MSGAVAAHAAYNGAGTQGLAVTNKINDTGDIMSVFWTKHDTTRQLLHGSSITEIVSSGSSGTSNAFGSSRIYTVNNDVDVLGDLFLDLTLNVTLTSGTASAEQRVLMDFELDHNFQYKLIDRVEFMIGTQIWHTLTGNDIKVITQTTKAESCSDILSKQIACERWIVGDQDNKVFPADASSLTQTKKTGSTGTSPAEEVKCVLWLPAMSADLSAPLRKFYNITENGYMMAAAPQQSVKIKVTFTSGSATGKFKVTAVTAAQNKDIYPIPTTNTTTLSTAVLDASGVIFDLPIPTDVNVAADADAYDYYPFKRLVIGHQNDAAEATVAALVHVAALTIGRARLFGKQIMLCKEERDQIRSVPNGLPYRIKMSQSIKAELPTSDEKTIDLDSFSLYASHLIISGDFVGANIISAELKLNSSSFSGSIPALLLRNDMAESLHLYSGRTLVNPHVQRGKYMENLGRFERAPLVFPLASTAFSGSSVPLNRFDSIRLILKFSARPTLPTGRTQSLTTFGITVTCVGETTVLYKGGAATLAMY
jgi:hypothetical protein